MFVQVSVYFISHLTPAIRQCISIWTFFAPMQSIDMTGTINFFSFLASTRVWIILFTFLIFDCFTFHLIASYSWIAYLQQSCDVLYFYLPGSCVCFSFSFLFSFYIFFFFIRKSNFSLFVVEIFLKTRTQTVNGPCFRFSPILSFLYLTYTTRKDIFRELIVCNQLQNCEIRWKNRNEQLELSIWVMSHRF